MTSPPAPRMPETLDGEEREELERLLKEAQDTPVPGGISASWDLIRAAIDALPALLAAEQRAEEAERVLKAVRDDAERILGHAKSYRTRQPMVVTLLEGLIELAALAPHKAAEED